MSRTMDRDASDYFAGRATFNEGAEPALPCDVKINNLTFHAGTPLRVLLSRAAEWHGAFLRETLGEDAPLAGAPPQYEIVGRPAQGQA